VSLVTHPPDRHAPPPPYPTGQPYPPPPPYAGYSRPPVGPRNGLGTASLVVAIIGLFTCAVVFGAGFGVAAVVIGVVALGRVRRGVANNGPVAVAGIVLGSVAIVASIAFIAIWITFWNNVGGADYFACLQKAGPDKSAQQQCQSQFNHRVQNRYGITMAPSR
jgi:hypothetical protein